MQDSKVQAALLRHPAVIQDQQVVLALLLTSKQLLAIVAKQCAGQVPAMLQAQHLKPVLCFTKHWLPKHGGLLRELNVQLGESSSWIYYEKWWSAALVALDTAFMQQQDLQLQAFCLRGAPADYILQHLPATCLTRLRASLDFRRASSSNTIAALSRLTGLCSLDLTDSRGAAAAGHSALVPIAALQQLTELGIGTLTAEQLQLLQLGPVLRHLDVAVDLLGAPQSLEQLAGWLEQHGRVLRRLALTNMKGHSKCTQRWSAAMHHFVAALNTLGASLQLRSFV